jgi:hypothetical protein
VRLWNESFNAIDVWDALMIAIQAHKRLYCCTFSEAAIKTMLESLRGNASIRELRM